MSEPTFALIQELQLIAKHASPQRRAKLDLPLLTALCQQSTPNQAVGASIDAAVAEAAGHPETAPLVTLFPPSTELWNSNLSGRQRQAAAEVGMSYDSFRRRRNGQPSPYDELCEALVELLVRSGADARVASEEVVDLVAADTALAESSGGHAATAAASAGGTVSVAPVRTTTQSEEPSTAAPAAATHADDDSDKTIDTVATRPPGLTSVLSKTRLWSLLAICALLVIAFIGARQLRSGTPDPVAAALPAQDRAADTAAATTNSTATGTTSDVDLRRPVGLVAAPVGGDIEVSWMPASGGDAPDGYDIARDDVGYWSLDDPSILTFIDDSVDPGRTYTYAVTPWLANGSDDPADRIYGPATETVEVAASLLLNSLGRPVDVVAIPSDAGITVEWNPPIEGATPDGFDIDRDGAGYWSLDDASARSFVDELVEPGRTYSYAVTPWLANGSDDPADRTYGPASGAVGAAADG